MKEQHRNIIRIAAVFDILVALGLFAAIVMAGWNVSLVAPAVLAFSGVMLIVITLVVK